MKIPMQLKKTSLGVLFLTTILSCITLESNIATAATPINTINSNNTNTNVVKSTTSTAAISPPANVCKTRVPLPTSNGLSVLDLALMTNDINTVNYLLFQQCYNPNSWDQKNGISPIFSVKSVQALELLNKAGASFSPLSDHKFNALQYLMSIPYQFPKELYGQQQQMINEAFATYPNYKVSEADKNHLAQYEFKNINDYDQVKLFVSQYLKHGNIEDDPRGVSPIFYMAMYGDLQAFKAAIPYVYDINQRMTRNNETLLMTTLNHYCALSPEQIKNIIEIQRILLSNPDIDLNARTKFGADYIDFLNHYRLNGYKEIYDFNIAFLKQYKPEFLMKNEERLHSAQNYNNRINRIDYGDLSCGAANYRDDGKMQMSVPETPPSAEQQAYFKSLIGKKNVMVYNAYANKNNVPNNNTVNKSGVNTLNTQGSQTMPIKNVPIPMVKSSQTPNSTQNNVSPSK
jgi:hypothetical protein